jgi:hypothetical protein
VNNHGAVAVAIRALSIRFDSILDWLCGRAKRP